MTKGRIAIVVACVLLMAGGAVGGYLIGAAGSADAAEAAEARQQAELIASIQARAQALPVGLARGFETGLAAGQTEGQEAGLVEGNSAGELAAGEEAEPVLLKNRGDRNPDDELLGPNAPPGQLPGTGGVLVVGDSLEVQTGPYLEQYLRGSRSPTTPSAATTATRSSTSSRRATTPPTR
jgi:hypothetical protein